MGTPPLAVSALRACLDLGEVPVVITQPDKPRHRRQSVSPSAVKEFALGAGIPVLQPPKLRDPAFLEHLKRLRLDVCVVAAYGKILPEDLLALPAHGCVNVHASLLPRFRGAAPIQWAIASGDPKTGVCLMKMDAGLDTGPVLACEETPIRPDETFHSLQSTLAELGGQMLRKYLPLYLRGALAAVPQRSEDAVYAPILKREDGLLDFSRSALEPRTGGKCHRRARRSLEHRPRSRSRLRSRFPGVARGAAGGKALDEREGVPGRAPDRGRSATFRRMTPRALAIQVLSRVAATDAFLNVVLDSQLSEHPFPERRDAALATELCYGSTRRQMTLDHLLRPLSERPLERLEDRVLAALRLGAYQMFYLRIPRRAVVAATVEALKEVGFARATGFVNAVLRKASTMEAIPLPPPSEIAEHLAIRESHPAWLVRRWIRQFGQQRTESMLIANNQPPPLTLRSNSTRVSRETLLLRFLAAGLEARACKYSSQGISLFAAGKPEDLPGFTEGLWQVQDEAGQCVVQFADFPAAQRVLDACAAPGGKACHLAERREVLASDKHRIKLAKLTVEAARLGLGHQIETLVHDATSTSRASVPT